MAKARTRKIHLLPCPPKWKSPPQCVIDIEEFDQQARQYAHLVTPDGLTVNPPAMKNVEKGIISTFIIDKKLNKIIKSNKYYVMKILALKRVGDKIQQIVKGKDFSMWEILLSTPEECIALTKKYLQNKDCILRFDYQGRQ